MRKLGNVSHVPFHPQLQYLRRELWIVIQTIGIAGHQQMQLPTDNKDSSQNTETQK